MALLLEPIAKEISKVKMYEQAEKGRVARVPSAGMDYRVCHGCGCGYYIMSNGTHPTTECPRLCQHVQARDGAAQGVRGLSAAKCHHEYGELDQAPERLTAQALKALADEVGWSPL